METYKTPEVNNIEEKSREWLKVFEDKGTYVFYGSSERVENNFQPSTETMFLKANEAIISATKNGNPSGFVYVYLKNDLSKPQVFVNVTAKDLEV